MAEKHIFTFGSGQKYPDKYIVINGDFSTARETMSSVFGDKWSFQYEYNTSNLADMHAVGMKPLYDCDDLKAIRAAEKEKYEVIETSRYVVWANSRDEALNEATGEPCDDGTEECYILPDDEIIKCSGWAARLIDKASDSLLDCIYADLGGDENMKDENGRDLLFEDSEFDELRCELQDINTRLHEIITRRKNDEE